jgi:hypothetical protein
MGSIS